MSNSHVRRDAFVEEAKMVREEFFYSGFLDMRRISGDSEFKHMLCSTHAGGLNVRCMSCSCWTN
jgi:hypothetical protein